MFILDGTTVVYSASDLVRAAACEFGVLRQLDAKLRRIDPPASVADAMLERVAQLGDDHERRVLASYIAQFGRWDPAVGRGVLEVEPLGRGLYTDRAALEAKHAETVAALGGGADVVYQGVFFDGRFTGRSDFLLRDEPRGDANSDEVDGQVDVVWAVYDTKLARHAKPSALLQLAAYADQLSAAGLTPAREVHVILGDRTITSHLLADLLPDFRESRARLEEILDAHQAEAGPVAWGDERYTACLRCEACAPELEVRRDVLLVAGLRVTQRVRLLASGITTMDEFAGSTGTLDGVGAATLDRLRAQAVLQVKQNPVGGSDGETIEFELFGPDAVTDLPAPDPGDIFFDFEGDPLWTETGGAPQDLADWGLEYLFGVVEAPVALDAIPAFRPFWAHDRTQEKQALIDFLAYVIERRSRFPGMHVYHYASYEKTALRRLAGRHGAGADDVETLVSDGVLVDLYATVKASLRTGQRSYSLKKLEPLYMEVGRSGDVTNASDSMVEYSDACEVRDGGDSVEWDSRLVQIANYNEYDCVSTLRLRDWLLARAAEANPAAVPTQKDAAENAAPGEGAGPEYPCEALESPADELPTEELLDLVDLESNAG